jgi:hypothetical protein
LKWGQKVEGSPEKVKAMTFWITLSIIGLLLGVLFTCLLFSRKNTHRISEQEQIRSLQRSVQEKNAEINLLYRTVHTWMTEGEASHKKIDVLQQALEKSTRQEEFSQSAVRRTS